MEDQRIIAKLAGELASTLEAQHDLDTIRDVFSDAVDALLEARTNLSRKGAEIPEPVEALLRRLDA